MTNLFVGTAGFSYKDWEGIVYPEGTADRLGYLARFFSCVEMNTTFYGVPKPESVQRWNDAVPDDFRFTFKLYRGLTHGEEDDALDGFLEALAPCTKLGAILLQFPYFFRNTQANRRRLSWLAGRLEGWPCALEVRDRSWLTPPALAFVGHLGLNLCAIDICQTRDSVPSGPLRTGPIGYVRFHGRNRDAWFKKTSTVEQKYDYLYSLRELEPWSRYIREIAAQAEATFVITNNHFQGKAVANAFMLARLLGAMAPEPPPLLRQHYPAL